MNNNTVRLLGNSQMSLVEKQHQKHSRPISVHYHYDYSGEGDFLDFDVDSGVWDPLLASGRYHARYLFYNTHLYFRKKVVEIGCGCGLMGSVVAKVGADLVLMGDISPLAVACTQKNTEKLGLHNVTIVESDLFMSIPKVRVGLVMWMIPFFSGFPEKGDTISVSMMMPPGLFERFLVEAKSYLAPNGVVLVPSFDLGGRRTDPRLIAPRFGYRVATKWSHRSTNGLQRGWLHMHELTLV